MTSSSVVTATEIRSRIVESLRRIDGQTVGEDGGDAKTTA